MRLMDSIRKRLGPSLTMGIRELISMPSCGVPKKTTPYIERKSLLSSGIFDLDIVISDCLIFNDMTGNDGKSELVC